MTIIESIKTERQNETREETCARALRYIERQRSYVRHTADTHALTKATSRPPLSEDAEWRARVERHREAIRARGGRPISAELSKPVGQAAEWLREVPVFREARHVAEQIARLCDDDSQVTTTFRSIADAAQLRRDVSDKAIIKMVELGWLSIEPSPHGTVFQLLVGDTSKTLTR